MIELALAGGCLYSSVSSLEGRQSRQSRERGPILSAPAYASASVERGSKAHSLKGGAAALMVRPLR